MSNTLQFFVGQVVNQGYFAVSKIEPFFCLHGNTEQEAVDSALKAWEFYLAAKGNRAKTHVKDKSHLDNLVLKFVPGTIITAEAC